MQSHSILSGISFVSGLLGVAGLAGAIEWGSGYCTCIALMIISIVSGICAGVESGNLRKEKRKSEKNYL